jgi:hypothetical protein
MIMHIISEVIYLIDLHLGIALWTVSCRDPEKGLSTVPGAFREFERSRSVQDLFMQLMNLKDLPS